MLRWNLIFNVLVAGILVTQVAEGQENRALLQITSPAPEMTPLGAISHCNAKPTQLSASAKAIFAAGLDEDVCGQCGAPYCWGAHFYDECGYQGGQCQPIRSCLDGTPSCYCLSRH